MKLKLPDFSIVEAESKSFKASDDPRSAINKNVVLNVYQD
jgi:hypothetical protein